MGAISFIIYDTAAAAINIDFVRSFEKLRPRGPDNTAWVHETTTDMSRIPRDTVRMTMSRSDIASYVHRTFVYGYHRLSINDPSSDGHQPFEDPIPCMISRHPQLHQRPKRKLLCNGEIYNWKDLVRDNEFGELDLQSGSDVEVILPMYHKYGIEGTLQRLAGDFAFVLTENTTSMRQKEVNVFVARDIFGTRPLWMVRRKDCFFYMFVSELKGLPDYVVGNESYEVINVPPGTYWSLQRVLRGEDAFVGYHDLTVYEPLAACNVASADPITLSSVFHAIRESIRTAVARRMHATMGVLLSGGFNSTILVSLLASLAHEQWTQGGVKTSLHLYTLGNEVSMDIKLASTTVEFLKERYGEAVDIHTHTVILEPSVLFDKKYGLINHHIDFVLRCVETNDVPVVREGVLYSVLLQYIHSRTPDVKVLLTGDGLNEACGGVGCLNELSDVEFQREHVNAIRTMHKNCLLRSESIASNLGVEVRYPFLDWDVVQYFLQLHPKMKRRQYYTSKQPPIEKYIVRKAFDTGEYAPEATLWRTPAGMDTCVTTFEKELTIFFENLREDESMYYSQRLRAVMQWS